MEPGAEIRRESAPFAAVRWFPAGTKAEELDGIALPTGGRFAFDGDNNAVALFPTEWSLSYFQQTNPKWALTSLAPAKG